MKNSRLPRSGVGSSRVQPPQASLLGQYWMVFAGTGVAMILVTAGVAVAVMALKKDPAKTERSLLPPESPSQGVTYIPATLVRPSLVPRPVNLPQTIALAPPVLALPAVADSFSPRFILEIAKKEPAAKPAENCNTCGTKVHFQSSPAAACKKAVAENKLVFILHVSGNFEDPHLT